MQRDLLMDQLEMSFLMRKRREEYIEQMEHSNKKMKKQDLYMEQAFQLKGKLFTLSVLQVESHYIKLLEKQLKNKIKLAPKFFNDTPIVIDIHKIEGKADQIDISALHKLLHDQFLDPYSSFRYG